MKRRNFLASIAALVVTPSVKRGLELMSFKRWYDIFKVNEHKIIVTIADGWYTGAPFFADDPPPTFKVLQWNSETETLDPL